VSVQLIVPPLLVHIVSVSPSPWPLPNFCTSKVISDTMPTSTISHCRVLSQTDECSAIMVGDFLSPSACSFDGLLDPRSTFVDKTLVIEAFLRDAPSHHLILRPRRCGKSFALSMIALRHFSCPHLAKAYANCLRMFLNRPQRELHSPVDITTSPFAKTFIAEARHRELVERHFQQYPVLYIDFKVSCFAHPHREHTKRLKDVYGGTFEEMLASFKTMVLDLLRDKAHLFVEEVVSSKYSQWYREMKDSGSQAQLTTALWWLSTAMYRACNHKIIVLIDEYDAPMRRAIEARFAMEVKFFASLCARKEAYYIITIQASDFFAQVLGSLLKVGWELNARNCA
jgi:hypothetical protein